MYRFSCCFIGAKRFFQTVFVRFFKFLDVGRFFSLGGLYFCLLIM